MITAFGEDTYQRVLTSSPKEKRVRKNSTHRRSVVFKLNGERSDSMQAANVHITVRGCGRTAHARPKACSSIVLAVHRLRTNCGF